VIAPASLDETCTSVAKNDREARKRGAVWAHRYVSGVTISDSYVEHERCSRRLEIFSRAAIWVILRVSDRARGFGGRHALATSPRQLKEVIQVAHTNVGSVAPLGALVGGEVHR
jgi:hypothetical protein